MKHNNAEIIDIRYVRVRVYEPVEVHMLDTYHDDDKGIFINYEQITYKRTELPVACLVYAKVKDKYALGFSICSEKDMFNKHIGKQVAVERAIKKADTDTPLDLTDEEINKFHKDDRNYVRSLAESLKSHNKDLLV